MVFVPMSIGALTGVRPVDAGIASGLFNTNVQIGGAIGVAAAITIATTATENFGGSHAGISAFTGAALTYGFDVGFRVLAATAAVGAVIAAFMLESRPSAAEPEPEVAHAALEPGSAA